MKRRDFIRTSAAAGVLALINGNCGAGESTFS
ncbi:MAG TPA: twin-arginine translocation signal domain-containing protein [Bacteroidales bacterium]|nr:twin-arginine translocation signal domain-containing protein [Bacteroidales bacterium]